MIKTLFGALILLFLSAFTVPSLAALGEERCVALFVSADLDQDGILLGIENDAFNEAMEFTGGKPRPDQPIDMEEFMSGCEKGHFDNLVMVE
jgi:hypothetical protein